MTLPAVILRQTLTMALYMAAGFVLFKTGKITVAGSKGIASLLLWLVIPIVIIDSFCVPYSAERLKALGASSLLGIMALILAILVSRVLFSSSPVDNFASAFSNAGFIGIPLVKLSLGDEAVFYLVGIITLLNLLQWTYGAAVLQKKRIELRPKNLFINPIFVGAVIGLALFITGIGGHTPEILEGAIKGISAVNAPLAMLVLGGYLAQTDLKSLLTTPRLYAVSAVRLLLIPLLTMLVFWVVPVDHEIKLAVILAAAAPVGANVAVYSQLYDLDYPYACKTVALSTILSIPALPLITMLAQKLIGA